MAAFAVMLYVISVKTNNSEMLLFNIPFFFQWPHLLYANVFILIKIFRTKIFLCNIPHTNVASCRQEYITVLIILRESVFFISPGRLTRWSGADNGVILRCFDKIIWLREFCKMLHISAVLCAESLSIPVTLLCPNK